MNGEHKFKVGDIVLYKGGLFRVNEVRKAVTAQELEWYGLDDICKVGDVTVSETEITKADWRDETHILKGGAPK